MGFISTNCPGCGSPIELDDTREYGFCQFCGTKIVQDKVIVEHKGEVKIDNSDLVEKYHQNANRALRKHDWEEVEKYYNLIEQNTFNNMEAAFFSSYGKAMLALSDSDFHKREQKFDVLKRSMSVISDYYEDTTEDKEAVLKKINEYIKVMYSLDSVNNYNKEGTTLTGSLVDGLLSNPGSLRWHTALLNGVKAAFLTELNQIREKHDDVFVQELINEYTNQGNNTNNNNQATTNEVKATTESSTPVTNNVSTAPKPYKWNSFSSLWNNETSRIGLITEITGFLILFLSGGTWFSIIVGLLLIICSLIPLLKYYKAAKAKGVTPVEETAMPVDRSKSKKALIVCVVLFMIAIAIGVFGGPSDSKYISTAKDAYLDLNLYGTAAQWSEEKVVEKDDYGRAIVVMRVKVPEYSVDGYVSAVVYINDGNWGYYYNGFKMLSGPSDEETIQEIKNSSYWNNPDFSN